MPLLTPSQQCQSTEAYVLMRKTFHLTQIVFFLYANYKMLLFFIIQFNTKVTILTGIFQVYPCLLFDLKRYPKLY